MGAKYEAVVVVQRASLGYGHHHIMLLYLTFAARSPSLYDALRRWVTLPTYSGRN